MPLAIGGADWFEIIVVVAIIVAGAIINIAKKAREKREEKDDREKWARRKEELRQRQGPPQAGPVPRPKPRQAQRPPAVPAQQQPAVLQPDAVKRPQDAAVPAPPRHRRRAAEAQQTRRPRQRQVQPKPRIVIPAARRVQQTDVVELETVDVVPPPVSTQAPALPVEVPSALMNLRDAEALKRAMLYHEIFSAPKATRGDQEMWET